MTSFCIAFISLIIGLSMKNYFNSAVRVADYILKETGKELTGSMDINNLQVSVLKSAHACVTIVSKFYIIILC